MVLGFRPLSSTRIVTIVLIIFSVIAVCQAGFSINPFSNPVTCKYTPISWGGGISDDKYTIKIIGDFDVVQYNIPNDYYNWFVTFPPSAGYFVEVTSQLTRGIADSADFTIQAGADQSCVRNISIVGPTSDPDSASITSTLANSSGTSTSTMSSGSITTLTSHSNSTSLLPLPPLLSRTSTGTSSDPTGVSSPSLADTGLASSSPNVGLIAGATCGGSVVLILLLLGICLYRRRKRLAQAKEQVETKAEETLPFTPYYPAYGSTIPRVKPLPPNNSHGSPAVTSQGVQPKRRTPSGIAVPLTTPGHNIAVSLATPAADNTTTSSYNPTVPPASTPSEHITSSSVISEPIEEPPPMYQSQQIRAEEAERMRRYDALIADFCASNRDLISPALERKLHAARYLPEDDPSDVTADYWLATYGIGSLELRRLQAAYERHVAVPPSN